MRVRTCITSIRRMHISACIAVQQVGRRLVVTTTGMVDYDCNIVAALYQTIVCLIVAVSAVLFRSVKRIEVVPHTLVHACRQRGCFHLPPGGIVIVVIVHVAKIAIVCLVQDATVRIFQLENAISSIRNHERIVDTTGTTFGQRRIRASSTQTYIPSHIVKLECSVVVEFERPFGFITCVRCTYRLTV